MTREELRKFEPLWDKWYIQEYLGGGSYGDVYRITCQVYESSYEAALKVISIPKDRSELAEVEMNCETKEDTIEYYDRLRQNITAEIDMMEQLKGRTNIVSFEDHDIIPHNDGKDPGYDIFIRMELLEDFGRAIGKESRNWTDNSQVVKLGRDVAEGLRICHAHNILHRDIKLGNIFRSKDGDYKIGDFGIARSVSDSDLTMSIKGTFNYMAPEVYNREHYDFRADIYSLGMVLYYLLNKNRGPFLPLNEVPTAEQKEMALVQRMSGAQLPAPVMASEKLAQIILKACHYNKEERFSSMEEFHRALLLLEAADMQRPEAVSGGAPDVTESKSASYADVSAEADAQTVAFVEPSVSSVSRNIKMDEVVAEPEPREEVDAPIDDPGDDDRTVAMDMSEMSAAMGAASETVQETAPEPSVAKKRFPVVGVAALAALCVLVIAVVAVIGIRKNASDDQQPEDIELAEDTEEEENETELADTQAEDTQLSAEEPKEPEAEPVGPVEPFCKKDVYAINKNHENKLVFEGDAFADITIKGEFQVSAEDETEVPGKLTLQDAPETIESSGDYTWNFVPEDAEAFQTVTGTVHITAIHADYVTGVEDVKAFKDKAALYKVDLTNSGLKDLSILEGAVNLYVVELDNNQLKDIETLAQCPYLEQVYLSGNAELSDIRPLLGLEHLKIFEAADTAISGENLEKFEQILQKKK